MLREFLLDSSIHGLRYLVLSRHPLSKLLWLLSICACATSAAVVIYLNVANWRESPAVVTKVTPELVKGSPFMPMVTVCPRYPNLNNLLTGLLLEHPQYIHEKDLMKRLSDLITKNYANVKVEETREESINSPREVGEELFGHCLENKNASGCDLILTLSAISNACGLDRFEAVKEYIINSAVSKTEVILEGMTIFASNFCGENVTKEWKSYPESFDDFSNVVEMYNHFFPTLQSKDPKEFDGYWEVKEVLPLRPLSEYCVPDAKTERLSASDFPTIFSYLIDSAALATQGRSVVKDDLNRMADEMLTDLIQKHLNLDNDLERGETLNFVNHFARNPLKQPALAITRKGKGLIYGYELECQTELELHRHSNLTIRSLCESKMELSQKCRQYCDKVVANNATHDLVRRLYGIS